MNMIWLKLLSLFIIFIMGLLSGLFPLNKKLSDKGKERLTMGNAFAGGVFLGAGLLHMLPDAIENFNSLAKNIDFPFPTLIAGIGFLMILILERATSSGSHHHIVEQKKGSFYPFILFIILSIHSIIAGASLGLEGAAISALAIFLAIIAHKGAAGFALGVSMKNAEYEKKKHINTIILFATMTPLGVLLGTLFSELLSSNTSIMFEMVFDSLAAGTFLYIAITEIIGKVFENPNRSWMKLVFIIAGFLLMTLIAIWT